ncbi:putative type II Glutamine amidotransferase [Klebsormidium nitens]|uniref:Putative type II Glutamine amidotransferase n=1 Tax=Klebsormidium nitens TaxID=105231 RepID=A0A1Y1I6K7_KLENI|nr:putative type II Glutamine amidotransferase [Klebsormidium nitens]|eukprot:GAQ85582.1 putative type II Glutamine amidotransferase [Klebsormidium nitens]
MQLLTAIDALSLFLAPRAARAVLAAAAVSLALSTFITHSLSAGDVRALPSLQMGARLVTQLLALRLGLVLSTLLHEWAHLAAGAAILITRKAFWLEKNALARAWFSLSNVLGNVPVSSWLACLVPFTPLPESVQPVVVLRGKGAAESDSQSGHKGGHAETGFLDAQDTFVRLGGWFVSGVCCVLMWMVAHKADGNLWGLFVSNVLKGCLYTFAGACASDLYEVLTGSATKGHFRCGNFGLILVKSVREGAKQLDIFAALSSMCGISSQRGGQSGGLVTYVKKSDTCTVGVRARIVPSKRVSVADKLLSTLRRLIWWEKAKAKLTGHVSTEENPVQMFLGHTRFATSSIPSPNESHPHQWSPPLPVTHWQHPPSAQVPTPAATQFSLFVTHNGDFEFWNLYGSDRTHNEMAAFLEKALCRPAPAQCDSVVVAGVVELLRTQGLWGAALRLAFFQTVVTNFSDVLDSSNAGLVIPDAAAQKAMAAVADAAYKAFLEGAQETTPDEEKGGKGAAGYEDGEGFARTLCQEMRANGPAPLKALPEAQLQALCSQAVVNFTENDLYTAVKKFLFRAKGSFGLVVTTSIDTDRVAMAALNQTMSMGFSKEYRTVLYSSEACGLKSFLQPAGSSATVSEDQVTHVFNLDEGGGEVLEVVLLDENAPKGSTVTGALFQLNDSLQSGAALAAPVTDQAAFLHETTGFDPFEGTAAAAGDAYVSMKVYRLKDQATMTQADFISSGRFTAVSDNEYLPFKIPPPVKDVVGQDIADIPAVISEIRAQWADKLSLNRRTAAAFFDALKGRVLEYHREHKREMVIDVVITGCESSLWIAEQFASDLMNMFPQLYVAAISSNKVIQILGSNKGRISAAGFAFGSLAQYLDTAVVLCISQSGQTFPTLHATRILLKQCPGRVFVCVGMIDSKMSEVVGQSSTKGAPFCARIFTNCAGWRVAEPASVSCVATHQTLTELMLFLARQMQVNFGLANPLGMRLSIKDVRDVEAVNQVFGVGVGELTGENPDATVYKDLIAQGRHWGWHILEGPIVWLMCAAYIIGTVTSHFPLFHDIWLLLQLGFGGPAKTTLFWWASFVDSLFYLFLPLMMTLLLRLVQRRKLLARIGKRTLVICDVPYVHQLLEIYVSKLFALSYSIASIDVHGANPLDHLVHRFTHRVTRGVLLAVGRPDGRFTTQTKNEAWVLMALLQAKSIVNLGVGAETLTVGHNLYSVKMIMDKHITIPSRRPRFICEAILGDAEAEPMRLSARQRAITEGQHGDASFYDDINKSVVGGHLLDSAPVRKARRRIKAQLKQNALAHTQSVRLTGESVPVLNSEGLPVAEAPEERNQLLSTLPAEVQAIFDSQAPLEELVDNRFLSLQRYISFLPADQRLWSFLSPGTVYDSTFLFSAFFPGTSLSGLPVSGQLCPNLEIIPG